MPCTGTSSGTCRAASRPTRRERLPASGLRVDRVAGTGFALGLLPIIAIARARFSALSPRGSRCALSAQRARRSLGGPGSPSAGARPSAAPAGARRGRRCARLQGDPACGDRARAFKEAVPPRARPGRRGGRPRVRARADRVRGVRGRLRPRGRNLLALLWRGSQTLVTFVRLSVTEWNVFAIQKKVVRAFWATETQAQMVSREKYAERDSIRVHAKITAFTRMSSRG
jgi:hypothetical protein